MNGKTREFETLPVLRGNASYLLGSMEGHQAAMVVTVVPAGRECGYEDCSDKACAEGVKKWLMEDIKAGGLEDMKTEWIPVTERLPGNYETVLVWIAESRIYDVAIYDTINGFRPWYSGYYEDCPEEWRDPVTAWMPLPEPYREERTEE